MSTLKQTLSTLVNRLPALKRARGALAGACLALISAAFALPGAPHAQSAADSATMVPNFWDPQQRLVRPNVKDRGRLRFLTVTDLPPFSFIDRRKQLAGFHVELARAICEELELEAVCQIQALPYGELESALNSGAGEVILAGIPVDATTRQRLSFTQPYFQLPGRFVAKAGSTLSEPLAQALAGQPVAVVTGTAHAAYAQAKFGRMRLKMFATLEDAMRSVATGETAAVFSDALALARIMQREGDKSCCQFVGGPYLSRTYFGAGLTAAVKRDDLELKEALDYALRAINQKGKFAELYRRYFPIGLF